MRKQTLTSRRHHFDSCASLALARARGVTVPARSGSCVDRRTLQRHHPRTMATLCRKGRGGVFFYFEL